MAGARKRASTRLICRRRKKVRHSRKKAQPPTRGVLSGAHHHLRVSGSGSRVATTTPDDKGMKKSDAIEARRVYMYIYRGARTSASSVVYRVPSGEDRALPTLHISELPPFSRPATLRSVCRSRAPPGGSLASRSRVPLSAYLSRATRGTLERKRSRPYRAPICHVI